MFFSWLRLSTTRFPKYKSGPVPPTIRWDPRPRPTLARFLQGVQEASLLKDSIKIVLMRDN